MLPPGGYMPLELPAGTHVVDLKLSDRYQGQSKKSFDVTLKQPTYVRIDTWNEKFGSTITRRFALTEQPASVAEVELNDCKLQDALGGPRFSKSHFFYQN